MWLNTLLSLFIGERWVKHGSADSSSSSAVLNQQTATSKHFVIKAAQKWTESQLPRTPCGPRRRSEHKGKCAASPGSPAWDDMHKLSN